MSDYIETPSVARSYCPGCETPEPGEITDVRWCSPHAPPAAGLDDGAVTAAAWISGTQEAGGEDNRLWCALFHRPRKDTR